MTYVTAVEALLEPAPRPTQVQAVVASLEAMVSAATLLRDEKQSLLSTLAWLHNESIGQAGRRLARELLSGREYGKLPPDKFFQQKYDLRSNIVHRGHQGDSIDLLEESNEMCRFVGDLLAASIGVPDP